MKNEKIIKIIGVTIFCIWFNFNYFLPHANPFFKAIVISPLAISVYGVISFLFKFREIVKGEKEYSKQIEELNKD